MELKINRGDRFKSCTFIECNPGGRYVFKCDCGAIFSRSLDSVLCRSVSKCTKDCPAEAIGKQYAHWKIIASHNPKKHQYLTECVVCKWQKVFRLRDLSEFDNRDKGNLFCPRCLETKGENLALAATIDGVDYTSKQCAEILDVPLLAVHRLRSEGRLEAGLKLALMEFEKKKAEDKCSFLDATLEIKSSSAITRLL